MASILLILMFAFYYHLGIGFGRATVKTIEGVRNANKEWLSNGVNPQDSIKNQLLELIDSTQHDY